MIVYVNEAYDSDDLQCMIEQAEAEIECGFYSLNEAGFGDSAKQFAETIRKKVIEIANKIVAAIQNFATNARRKLLLKSDEKYSKLDPKMKEGIVKVAQDMVANDEVELYYIPNNNLDTMASAIARGEKEDYIEQCKAQTKANIASVADMIFSTDATIKRVNEDKKEMLNHCKEYNSDAATLKNIFAAYNADMTMINKNISSVMKILLKWVKVESGKPTDEYEADRAEHKRYTAEQKEKKAQERQAAKEAKAADRQAKKEERAQTGRKYFGRKQQEEED